MLRNITIAVCIIAMGCICLSRTALANDRDLRATTVPATACEPVDSAQAAEVRLSNAGWVFRGANTGTITFYCPLPRNGVTLSNTTDDNDTSSFRIYYRDTDCAGTAAQVTARLVYRQASALFFAGGTWNSNTVPNCSGFNMTAFHPNVHDVRFNALYSFLVTLRRTNIEQDPAFSGIDFTFTPLPIHP